MPQGITTTESSLELPVTTNARSKGRIGIERSAVPPLIGLSAGLVAVSSNQPRATLLFVGAGIVIVGFYFVVPPVDDKDAPSFLSTFLRKMPDVLTAAGCTLIVLGIGVAFPNEVALIPLFLFISFVTLAALFGMRLGVWPTAVLYGAALVSLVTFVVLAFMA